jgi:hypothetical protein
MLPVIGRWMFCDRIGGNSTSYRARALPLIALAASGDEACPKKGVVQNGRFLNNTRRV